MTNTYYQHRGIIICGGSLAGLAAAIQLKQLGHQPCVFEKSKFPREKLCGEFLGPDALKTLDELGLLQLIENKAYGPVTDAYFYNTDGEPLHTRMSMIHKDVPYALAIPRNELDFLLQQYARDIGIEIIEETRILPNIQKDNGNFTIQIQGEESERYCSKVLVDATGRYGGLIIQDASKEQKHFEKTMGLQCHVQISLADKALHMFLFPGGYGGLQPTSPDTANLCMLFSKSSITSDSHDRFALMIELITQNPKARQLLKHVQMLGKVNSTGGLNSKIHDTGLLQIGDARLTVDPFTGTGMAHALDTGILAAKIINQSLQKGHNYTELLKQYERRYKAKYFYRLQALNWFRPFLFSQKLQRWTWPFMKAGVSLLAPIIR